jgi:hypothetical protein
MIEQSYHLSNRAREKLIQQKHPHAAIVIDALYSAGFHPGHKLQMGEAQALLSGLYGISGHTVRLGLKSPVFRRRKAKSTGGRCAYVYTLPHPHQVERWYLVLDDLGISDNLPAQAFKSVSSYKMHLHGAMIRRLTHANGGKFKLSRATMSERIAVCRRTLRRYEKQMGVNVQQNITQAELQTGFSWNLPAEKNQDRSQWLVVIYPDGSQRRFPAVRAIAARAAKLGWTVIKVRQRMNTYEYWGFEYDNPNQQYTDLFTRTDNKYNPRKRIE